MRFKSVFLLGTVVVIFTYSCKKSTENSNFKVENGLIGILYDKLNSVAVDPISDRQFIYKKSKVRYYYSTISALNGEQSKLYVQFRDSTYTYFLQEIDTKTGELTGSYELPNGLSNIVFDVVHNRLMCLMTLSSSSLTVYSFDLSKKMLQYLGNFSGTNLYLYSGKSFMRNGQLYFNSLSDLSVLDFTTMEIKKVTTMGNCWDLEYDPVNDVAYALIGNGVGMQLDKYNFSNNTLNKLMDLNFSNSFVQGSLCLNLRSNTMFFFYSGQKKITIDLDALDYKVETCKYMLTGCQSMHNNVEVALNEIE